MSNSTLSPLRGGCPAPFFDQTKFGQGGYVDGRFCADIDGLGSCCLPCPASDYIYPSNFTKYYRAAEALNLVGLICMAFLMISFLVLPPEQTRRHYLSYCLVIAASFIALGFVIPFGAKPEQCFDEITPNDMYTSLTCAFSGAFIIAGGMSIAVWIFIRALSMHLQICWDLTPGKRFFYWAQGLGWSVAAAFFTATITVTGVSFRFGDVCHVNATHSLADFWGPLLAIAGAATLVQLGTFGYCIKVYLSSMLNDDKTETQSSMGLPSYTNSVNTRSPRTIYRRVRKVLYLQWRGITIVIFILVDVIFFSVVFVWLNSITSHATDNIESALPFLICLMNNPIHHDVCTAKAEILFVNNETVIAVLLMLSMASLQCFMLLVRASMFKGWYDLVRIKLGYKREFVSLDAHKYAVGSDQFELSNVPQTVPMSAVASPTSYKEKEEFDPCRRSITGTPDYFSKENTREYAAPKKSFSAPRAPSQAMVRDDEWDPRATHARGGLGFHPPVGEEDYHENNKI